MAMVSWLKNMMGGGGTAVDPVCGMKVDKKNPPGGTVEYRGTTYYFCAAGCRMDFQHDQEGYLTGHRKHAEM